MKLISKNLVLMIAHIAGHHSQATEIHLEHSFIPEGSSWGTDDSFRQALLLTEAEIPTIYKTQSKRRVKVANLSDLPLAQGRFINHEASLFREIHLCFDESLALPNRHFDSALEDFVDNVSGRRKNEARLKVSYSRPPANPSAVATDCDVYFQRGSWKEFPYKFLPDHKTFRSEDYQGKVFAVYYRKSTTKLPVVTVHPEILLSFQPPEERYVQKHQGKLLVDARALYLHEIGHLLGFDHLDPEQSPYQHPEASIMGRENTTRSAEAIHLRFSVARELWKFWDSHQSSIYRRMLIKNFFSRCQPPEKSFTPVEGVQLSQAVTEFNQETRKKRPWGFFEISEEMVKESIRQDLWRIDVDEACKGLQSVLAGVMPHDFRLDSLSGIESCVDGIEEEKCRYFAVRLETYLGSPGKARFPYSIRVGEDVREAQKTSNPTTFEYSCLQPGDQVHINLPAFAEEKHFSQLAPYYQGEQLFKQLNDLFSFQPIAQLRVEISTDDYENEIKFSEIRFLRSAERIYPWLTLTAQENGVAHDIQVRIFADNEELSKSHPISINVEDDLSHCN